MKKPSDLDFVLKSIGKGSKGRKTKSVKDHQLKDENGNPVFKDVMIEGQSFRVPVYGEIKKRPKTYGKIRGKQTSDAQLVAKGDLNIEVI